MAMVRSSGTNVRYDFHYVIDDAMGVICAKTNNITDNIRQPYVSAGRLKGRINSPYLEGLKDQVRYWDGRDWRQEVVKVKHLTIVP
jgi:hypothetical protein